MLVFFLREYSFVIESQVVACSVFIAALFFPFNSIKVPGGGGIIQNNNNTRKRRRFDIEWCAYSKKTAFVNYTAAGPNRVVLRDVSPMPTDVLEIYF